MLCGLIERLFQRPPPPPPPEGLRASDQISTSSLISGGTAIELGACLMAAEGWSELPTDLLWKIIERLPIADYIRFGAICVSWHAALAEKRQPPPPQLPWLLLPSICDGGTESPIRTFSLTDDKEYYMDIPDTFRSLTCIGSSHGWLIFFQVTSPESKILIFDPISRVHLTLPSIAMLPTSDIDDDPRFPKPQRFMKVEVSPYGLSCFMAFAIRIFSGSLAFAREGDTSWTTVKMPDHHKLCEIIFYKEQLWGLTTMGWVVACELSDVLNPKVTFIARGPRSPEFKELKLNRYLVEADGALLVVWRGMRQQTKAALGQIWRGPSEKINGQLKTTDIKVFKLAFFEKEAHWSELKSLGDHTLFLGHNPSIAISSRDFPELRNCIHLTNLHRLGDHRSDLLMYHMEDKSFKPSLSLCMSESKRPQMFWFTPNLIVS